jgi:hypothetical protein
VSHPRNDEQKTAERHCEERSDEANQRKNRLIMKKEILKFPSGISLGRNFTATKLTCGAAAVFQVNGGNPHDMQKKTLFLPSDAFLTECEKQIRKRSDKANYKKKKMSKNAGLTPLSFACFTSFAMSFCFGAVLKLNY